MNKTSGISLQTNAYGVPVYATFDLKQYGSFLMPLLKEKGLVGDEIKLSKKLQNRIQEVQNGEFSELNILEL